jgi:predicted acylesterase/phospholipase RssA
MSALYRSLGETVFRKSWRSLLWPLTRYRYPSEPLEEALLAHLGQATMGDLWGAADPVDLVITLFDLVEMRTRFAKPWKTEYASWPLTRAVLASCTVPTLFPVVDGRYVDGGVGSYSNPCYLAAYEAAFCLGWPLEETTIISLGTGREPPSLRPGDANRFRAWNWLVPVLGAFLQSADEQQVHLVGAFFQLVDFRRFQVDLRQPIASDDWSALPLLDEYGQEMGRKILHDDLEPVPDLRSSSLQRDFGVAASVPRPLRRTLSR